MPGLGLNKQSVRQRGGPAGPENLRWQTGALGGLKKKKKAYLQKELREQQQTLTQYRHNPNATARCVVCPELGSKGWLEGAAAFGLESRDRAPGHWP